MSDIVKDREKVIKHLCKGTFYCVGLSRFGGPNCPCLPDALTIKDIQLGHVQSNTFKKRAAWREALKHPKQYVPLCVICNYRMRSLKDELYKYVKEFRRKVAEYTGLRGGIAASQKFNIGHTTALKWRRDFSISKYIRRKYPKCLKYRSHSFNTRNLCSGCGYRKGT